MKRGYVALMTVIVLGSVSALVAMSLVLLGLGQTRTSLAASQSVQARSAAMACTEDALRQIRLSSAYVGTGGLTLGGATCTYTVTNTGGNTRSILSAGLSANVTRRTTVNISALSPDIVFSQWQEN